MFKNFLFVMTGGALGSALRYSFALLLPLSPNAIPWATFFVNLIGSFLISFLLAGSIKDSTSLKLFLCTGILGGFTTYSSFNQELVQRFMEGQNGLALTYLSLTLLSCFAGGLLGFYLSRRFLLS